MGPVQRAAALCLLSVASGCGSELSNAAWVRQPESSAPLGDESVTLEHEATTSLTLSDATPQTGPRRLDHTVTLGEVVATPPSGGAIPGSGSTTVVVNVNNYAAPGYAPYYGGYWGGGTVALGAERGGASRPAPSHGGSAPIIPGRSWPAAASYGPSFPYSTSPASPWETKSR